MSAMATSYEEWKNYDPNDEQDLSSAEVAGKRLASGWGHAKQWGKDVGTDLMWGAPMLGGGLALRKGVSALTSKPALRWATQHGLQKALRYMPFKPLRMAGNVASALGAMQMTWAPITATKNTVNNIVQPVEPPQTDSQRLKKWFRNTGIGAGIGLGTAALGKVLMFVPVPGARAVGGALIGAGTLAAKLAPVESTVEMGVDRFFRNGKPRPTPPPPQPVDRTQNYVGAGLGGAAGFAGGYALGGMIPAIRKRKALRMALAAAAAYGGGRLGWNEAERAKTLNRQPIA